MSVVIVGGNERMECQYRQICKQFGYKAKVFTKMPADFKKQIGRPDLVVLFTNTVSHKMVGSAVQEATKTVPSPGATAAAPALCGNCSTVIVPSAHPVKVVPAAHKLAITN